MRITSSLVALSLVAIPALAAAQSGPMSTAMLDDFRESNAHLVAAAQAMPATFFSYRPTDTQRRFGEIMAHAAMANDYLCSLIGGVAAPTRTKLAADAGKDALIARLQESMSFCDRALAHASDATLGDTLSFLGHKATRAAVIVDGIADWESHYSQAAAYLRLNHIAPPKMM